MIATSQDPVQSQPHSHTEYVNFEPSQHITINKLEDFHIVTAIIAIEIYRYSIIIIVTINDVTYFIPLF